MNEEIKDLLIKAEENNEEALEATIMLSKVYAYGLYGEKKDLEKAEFWSNKARVCGQRLSKEIYLPFLNEQKQSVQKKENIKINRVSFSNRFDNIQCNLKFVNIKHDINKNETIKTGKTFTNRFNNIQNNLKFVGLKNTTNKKEDTKTNKAFTNRFDNIQNNLKFIVTKDDELRS